MLKPLKFCYVFLLGNVFLIEMLRYMLLMSYVIFELRNGLVVLICLHAWKKIVQV